MRTLLLPLIFIAAATVRADDFPSGAIETARESVVQVFGNSRIKGGGVVVDREGLVLTACHLADGTNMAITVEYPDGQRVAARPLAVDVQADLMLLTPLAVVSNATPAAFTRRELEEGQELVSIGPGLWEATVSTYGRVASPGPRYREFGKLGYCSRFRLYNAMTPQLFSGSGWFTRDGRLAGIQSGYLNNHHNNEMSGLAMVACLEDLKRLVATRKDAATPDLGGILFELWSADKGHIDGFPEGSEGVLITKREKDGALARAGLPLHALIQSVEGRRVRSRVEFFEAIRQVGPGNGVTLGYRLLKTEEPKEAVLTFGSLEAAWWAKRYPRETPASP